MCFFYNRFIYIFLVGEASEARILFSFLLCCFPRLTKLHQFSLFVFRLSLFLYFLFFDETISDGQFSAIVNNNGTLHTHCVNSLMGQIHGNYNGSINITNVHVPREEQSRKWVEFCCRFVIVSLCFSFIADTAPRYNRTRRSHTPKIASLAGKQCRGRKRKKGEDRNFLNSDNHGLPKVNFWEDPLSPSKWKEEQFAIVSLVGWGALFYGGYKFFTKGKKRKLETYYRRL